jgi:CDP-glycerol glycerophosphotransferase (TagB/SpsB family)
LTIFFNGYSGSNLSPILEELVRDEACRDWRIEVIREGQPDASNPLSRAWRKFWSVARSKAVLSTHGVHKLKRRTIHINLWHGIPLKAMGLMDKGEQKVEVEAASWQDDVFASTSTTYSTAMNACFALRTQAYQLLGYPRNDYLFSSDGRALLREILQGRQYAKTILFVPTFRDYTVESAEPASDSTQASLPMPASALLPVEDFDLMALDAYLRAHDWGLVIKRHPFDEEGGFNAASLTNIHFLGNEEFERREQDFYTVLNGFDMLITDYSSIYFDYLLLDRPLVFLANDIEQYKSARGILLEPYDFWTPGPKCSTQNELIAALEKSLAEPSYYAHERKRVRDIFHDHQDGASTARVMKVLRSAMLS